MSFTIATTVDEALVALGAGARPIAGGTDLVVGARHGKAALPADLVAIDRIDELGGVELDSAGVRVGALMSHAELMTDPVIVGSYTAIADASALVGSPSTRHVGTLGGNVMNGSPAMDTGAPLTARCCRQAGCMVTRGGQALEPSTPASWLAHTVRRRSMQAYEATAVMPSTSMQTR